MKKFSFLALIVLIAMSMTTTSCVSINPGEVGLKIHKRGSKKGQIEIVRVGWEPVSLTGAHFYEMYPNVEQEWCWTGDSREGSPDNQEIVYQSKEGEVVAADIAIRFKYLDEQEEKFINMYAEWMKTPQQIIDDKLYQDVRDAFNKYSPQYTVLELYSSKKDEIKEKVVNDLKLYYSDYAINIVKISYLSNIRIDPRIKEQITGQIVAIEEEKKVIAEEKVAKATADKQEALADGTARALIKEAEGRAQAMDAEGAAIRRNPQYLQLKQLDVQKELAESLKGATYLNFSAEQSSTLFSVGK